MDGYLDAVRPPLLNTMGGAGDGHQEKKICYQQNQWRQDPPGVGYTPGKRGAQRHATPVGRSPALKPWWRWWHVSGQAEREAQEGLPVVSNGERARASLMLCLPSCNPYRGRRTCPPNGCVSVMTGGEDAKQGFSGPLSIAPLGLLMEKSGSRIGL